MSQPMEIKTIDADKFIAYDTKAMSAKIYSKAELTKEIKQAEARLKEIPEPISDAELLEWARINHPKNMDYSAEKANLEKIVAENTSLLEAVK